jgi:hypothetical protein
MGAMIRLDGLFACGAGTADVGQRNAAEHLKSSRSYGYLRDGQHTGLSGRVRHPIS